MGVNVTLTVQVAPAASIAVQFPPPNTALPVQPKFPLSVPASIIIVAGTAPRLVTMKVCSLGVPVVPKSYGGGFDPFGGELLQSTICTRALLVAVADSPRFAYCVFAPS